MHYNFVTFTVKMTFCDFGLHTCPGVLTSRAHQTLTQVEFFNLNRCIKAKRVWDSCQSKSLCPHPHSLKAPVPWWWCVHKAGWTGDTEVRLKNMQQEWAGRAGHRDESNIWRALSVMLLRLFLLLLHAVLKQKMLTKYFLKELLVHPRLLNCMLESFTCLCVQVWIRCVSFCFT